MCARRMREVGRWMWSGGTDGAVVVVAALDEAFEVVAGLFGWDVRYMNVC